MLLWCKELLNSNNHIAFFDCICSTCCFSPRSDITSYEEGNSRTGSYVAEGCETLTDSVSLATQGIRVCSFSSVSLLVFLEKQLYLHTTAFIHLSVQFGDFCEAVRTHAAVTAKQC